MWASILSRLNGAADRKVERIDHEVVELLLSAGIKDRCIWNYRDRDGVSRVELRRLAGTNAIYSVAADVFLSMRDDQVLAAVIAGIALNRSADRTHPSPSDSTHTTSALASYGSERLSALANRESGLRPEGASERP
jgi:hypothetical protein